MMWHLLGDSFLNAGLAMDDLREQTGRSISMTQDGVGSSSLTDQADRFDLTPDKWERLLIINDGGFDGNATQAKAAVDRMRANLTHSYWLYMESMYEGVSEKTQELAAYIGDHFVPTHAYVLEHGAISDPEDPGYAEDQADVVAGRYPASCRSDAAHPNAKGRHLRNEALLAHMQTLGWL